jgi:hypothetical protein
MGSFAESALIFTFQPHDIMWTQRAHKMTMKRIWIALGLVLAGLVMLGLPG